MHRALLLIVALGSWASAQSPSPLRLPGNVRPLKYQATLDVTPGKDSFSGVIEISVAFTKPTAELTLHAKELRFGAVTPAPLEIQNGENDLVTLRYGSAFPVGTSKFRIAYQGSLSRILTDGAFQQQHAGDWYVFTKFEPITARRVFPCFDEPGFKVPWQLSLKIPKDLKAFSNTSIASEEPSDGGEKLVRFRETPPLPSYLIAFAVGPFDVVDTAPVGRKKVQSRIVVPKGRAAEAEYAASITPKLIAMLEGYFGMPYPYEKLDQVVVPLTTAWGAMENAGMIAYGDFLLAPKAQDSEARHQQVALTMEHEMSHQWFGDLVTMQWWNDLWLNEAFASWISNKLVAGWHPEWRINEERAAATVVFRADSLSTARKIRQPIEAAGDIGTAFDGITYGKGQAVIGMFESYTGELQFQRAVEGYLRTHAFGNATADDLMTALDRVSPGKSVGDAFRTFIDQVGFPLVNVEVDCSSSASVRLSQKRLTPRGSSSQENALWDVPICLSWNAGGQCVLLKSAEQSFALKSKGCPAWLFANAGAAGYYAVTYSSDGGDKLLSKGVRQLSRTEKAAFLRNVRLLFSSGLGDLKQELRAVEAFGKDDDPNLVQETASMMQSVDELVPQDLRSTYAARIEELYGERARALGWRPKATDTPEIRRLRGQLVPMVATDGGDAALSEEAGKLAQEWLKDHKALESEVVPEVLFAAAWAGDRELFDQMTAALRATDVQRERSWIIAGLAGFRDTSIAEAALALIGAPGIDARETSRLLFNGNVKTREAVWQYVQANFDRLNSLLPSARGVPFGAILPDATSGFCDAGHANEAEAFFKTRLAVMPGGNRNLARALERIRLCEAQAEVARPAVAAFLRP